MAVYRGRLSIEIRNEVRNFCSVNLMGAGWWWRYIGSTLISNCVVLLNWTAVLRYVNCGSLECRPIWNFLRLFQGFLYPEQNRLHSWLIWTDPFFKDRWWPRNSPDCSTFMGPPNLITYLKAPCHFSLSQMNPIHILPPFNINFIFSYARFTSFFFLLLSGFLSKFCGSFSHFPIVLHAPYICSIL